jgi:hypothetical protein
MAYPSNVDCEPASPIGRIRHFIFYVHTPDLSLTRFCSLTSIAATAYSSSGSIEKLSPKMFSFKSLWIRRTNGIYPSPILSANPAEHPGIGKTRQVVHRSNFLTCFNKILSTAPEHPLFGQAGQKNNCGARQLLHFLHQFIKRTILEFSVLGVPRLHAIFSLSCPVSSIRGKQTCILR